MVLEHKVKNLLIDRHDKNGVLFDLFFSNPEFQVSLVRYLATTHDEYPGTPPASLRPARAASSPYARPDSATLVLDRPVVGGRPSG